jgi:RNA polymerase sigma factor (sigma-70 family)
VTGRAPRFHVLAGPDRFIGMEGRGEPHRRNVSAREAIPPFQSFMDQHRAIVYRFLLVSVGPAEADDCFQETFLAALRAYPALRHGDNLRGWIMAIASRKAIDFARARARRPVPVGEVADRPAPDGMPLEGDDEVMRAVRRLPPQQSVALFHRVVLDQTYEATAAALGCSVETARAHVYQGLKRLRNEVSV